MRRSTGFCQTTAKLVAQGFRCIVSGERKNSSFHRQFCLRHFSSVSSYFKTNFSGLLFPYRSITTVGVGSKKSTFSVLYLIKYDLFYRRTVDKNNSILTPSSSTTRFFSSTPPSSTLINNYSVGRRRFGCINLLNSANINKSYYSGLLLNIDKRSFGDWILTSSSRVPDRNNNTNKVDPCNDDDRLDQQRAMEYFENNSEKPVFKPKRVVILTKLTRLEFERRTNPDLSEDELAKCVRILLLCKFRSEVGIYYFSFIVKATWIRL